MDQVVKLDVDRELFVYLTGARFCESDVSEHQSIAVRDFGTACGGSRFHSKFLSLRFVGRVLGAQSYGRILNKRKT